MAENTEATQNDQAADNAEKPARPFLKVIKGNPDATQVATLTTLFAVMADQAAGAQQEERERNMWGDISEQLSRPSTFNPNAFRNVQFY
ncbi:acyl-CoA carboxylase subunit epsilon [Corynebacterium pelargi]|uniref:Uncharacterized protein n=1 Tax=Corynebacterium pelargi TaxID=1471400 RepID=A0A410WAI3_9CORY|nr:acyl-CoA carboxylase subunit epsilon [Corynebacterium pelargi]QAU52955.1 hypothetical protein CPELA_08500 [Corynebacterium pelargi]GGG75829.1 acyl-CoA carboxylase subunit epsilon [Corynebacterium pelargi]